MYIRKFEIFANVTILSVNMKFVIFQLDEIVVGEETTIVELKQRLSELFPSADYRSTIFDDELNFCALPEPLWPSYDKVIIIANEIPFDEIKLHAVTWWIENE